MQGFHYRPPGRPDYCVHAIFSCLHLGIDPQQVRALTNDVGTTFFFCVVQMNVTTSVPSIHHAGLAYSIIGELSYTRGILTWVVSHVRVILNTYMHMMLLQETRESTQRMDGAAESLTAVFCLFVILLFTETQKQSYVQTVSRITIFFSGGGTVANTPAALVAPRLHSR